MMRSTIRKLSIALLLGALLVVARASGLLQATGQKRTLIINGQSTHVPVIQVNGLSYIELEALADAINGSVSYSENTIVLSAPFGSSDGAAPTTSSAASPPASGQGTPSNSGLSREFLKAGIEQMSTLREWHTALATAIRNGIPLSGGWLEPYRAQAATNLRLASVAATTSSDRSAYQLLDNEFQSMAKLSDKYVNLRANLSYISRDALEDDELNKRIIACGRSLGAMAASGQFVDDVLCH
jgi:hypothetical protein